MSFKYPAHEERGGMIEGDYLSIQQIAELVYETAKDGEAQP
jgi:hypothetical protein